MPEREKGEGKKRKTHTVVYSIFSGLVIGQADVPVVQLGVSEELVHAGKEASITCRVQNQGAYKSKFLNFLIFLSGTCSNKQSFC